ncbi:MAG: methyltransferase domain-containing protein [Alphaproteobacteria bacterium]|nr:methyltransferase domain-containing protein [Alphaproteobacteria bacterium]
MIPAAYPDLASLVQAQLAIFPEHESYLSTRFRNAAPRDLAFANELAAMIKTIAGQHLSHFCADYRWLAEVIIEEEIFFRREGRYRLSTFAEADAQVYSNEPYMRRYVNGILLSQLWWANHTSVMQYFRDTYLPGLPAGARHLEIGPGHGLYLYMAAREPRLASVAGWDVSPASIAVTTATFKALGYPGRIDLALVNLFDAPGGQFDSITLSEVLEHVEEPDQALRAIARLLAPGGRAFINVPVNSPAPDHIILFRTPEAVFDTIREAGFDIEATHLAPISGATLERARKLALTISATAIARKR